MALIQSSICHDQLGRGPVFSALNIDVLAEVSTDGMSASSAFRGKAPPTPQDWQAIRPIFTQLYSVENKTLKSVVRILEDEHGFHATKRMYNKRINDWNIHKNYKKSEKAVMVRAIKVDKASKKSGQQRNQVFAGQVQLAGCTFKGRPVKVDRLVRYMKETHSLNNDLRPLLRGPPDPARLITDYGETKDAETLFGCASQYLNFYIASIIVPHPSRTQKISHGIETSKLANVGAGFDSRIRTAMRLQRHGRITVAFRKLNEAMDDMKDLFLSHHPNLISRFFRILWLTREVDPELNQSFWDFAIKMAKTVLGSSHPVVIACAIVQTLAFDDANMSIWQTLNDILRNGLGVENPGVFAAQDWYFSSLVFLGRHQEILQYLDWRLARKKTSESIYHQQRGVALAKLGRCRDAEFSLRKCLAMTPKLRDIEAITSSLAIVLEYQGNYLAAHEQWLEVVNFSFRVFGLLHQKTLKNVSSFERFLQRHAQYEEAAALRSQYPHVFQ